jgi:hypothetical protein
VSRALLRFGVLGAMLFAASRGLAPAPGAAPVEAEVALPAAEVAALRRGFVAERARAPEPEELAALVQARIDDEVLFREALALGLDQDDPVVARRLVENARFLAADGESDASLVEPAGLRLHDPVVRRRLVNRMRLRLAAEARGEEPSAAELARLRAARLDALTSPPRVRISQVYLGPARGLALPTSWPALSEEMLARSFGPEFARVVFSLAPGQWVEPIRSVHGLHRVRVEMREEGEAPAAERVDGQLRDAWQAARDARAVEAALVELRRRHPVRVEPEGTRS